MTVAVAINVYDETTIQLTECFKRVKANLTEAKVFLDGVDRPEVLDLAASFGFESFVGQSCGNNEKWFLWWLRMLEFFQSTGADVCFKIDPDTMVDRPPVLIDADYFGTIESFNGYSYVQGGITGMSQRAVGLAKEVLEKGTFKSLRDCVFSGGPVSGCYEGPVTGWYFADDHAIAHVFKQVGILPTQWNECFASWTESTENKDLRFAMVHPRYYRA